MQFFNNSTIASAGRQDIDFMLNELNKSNYFTKGNSSLLFIVLYSISIVLGLIVNSIVIGTVIKYRHMRTSTNAFVINLTVFDLLVILFCMPSRILNEINSQWFLHDNTDFICKLSSFIQDSAVSGSILTLTFISCTRIYAVHYPFKVKLFLTKFKLFAFIFLIWFIVLVFSTPSLIFKRMHKTEIQLNLNNGSGGEFNRTLIVKACIEDWMVHNRFFKKTYNLVFFVFFYFLPLVTIFVNYMRIVLQMFNSKMMNTDEGSPCFKPHECNNSNSVTNIKVFQSPKHDNESNVATGKVSILKKLKLRWSKKIPTHDAAHETVSLSQTRKFWEMRLQQRRKICKMFVLISALFGLSWAPMHVINLLIELNVFNDSLKQFNVSYYYALWFGHLNSIINPLCYALCCKKFKQCFIKK